MSTGKAGTPNPCETTTLAVLWPTPGNFSNSFILLGTTPLNLLTRIFDRFEIA